MYVAIVVVLASLVTDSLLVLSPVINSERAAMHAPDFKEKHWRTREMLLNEITNNITNGGKVRRPCLARTHRSTTLLTPSFADWLQKKQFTL